MVFSYQRRLRRGPSLATVRSGATRPAEDQTPARGETLPFREWALVYFLVALSFVAILVSFALYPSPADEERNTDGMVRDDLRRAFEAAERVRADSGSYLPFTITPGESGASPRFQPSQGVDLSVEIEADGLKIVGGHRSSTSQWCVSSVSKTVVEGDEC